MSKEQINEMKKFMQIAEGMGSEFRLAEIIGKNGLAELLRDLDKNEDIEEYGNSYFEKLYFHFLDEYPDEIPVGSRTGRPDDPIEYVRDNLERYHEAEIEEYLGRSLGAQSGPEGAWKSKLDTVDESDSGRPYICVHAKKGKYECNASSSYGAAKKAAEHWGLKSTAGIDAHLADVSHSTQFVGESAPNGPYTRARAARLFRKVAKALYAEADETEREAGGDQEDLEFAGYTRADGDDYAKIAKLFAMGRPNAALKKYDGLDTASSEYIYDHLEPNEVAYLERLLEKILSKQYESVEDDDDLEQDAEPKCSYCDDEEPLDGFPCLQCGSLQYVDEESGDDVCKDCEGEGCEWCDPDYDDLDDFGGFRGTYDDDIEEASNQPHKYTYVYTDQNGNKTYIGVQYTEGDAIPKIRLWNEDRLPYAITNVMFMRDGGDKYLTDLFKDEVFNAFFDEETGEPRVADSQQVLDAIRDATRLGKAIVPVQNEAVEEDVDGMGHYNVVYHDDEIETALPYDKAVKAAMEFIKNVWLGQPPTIKKLAKGDSVVFTWIDGNERDSVIVEPTDDADIESWHGESINLSGIVESVLKEAPPIDYFDPEYDFGPLARGKSSLVKDLYPEAEDEEMSLDIAWPPGVSVVDADDELEENADDMDADDDGVIDDNEIDLLDISINADLEDF